MKLRSVSLFEKIVQSQIDISFAKNPSRVCSKSRIRSKAKSGRIPVRAAVEDGRKLLCSVLDCANQK